jgi:diacylglycerol kinase (ATP)
MKKFITGRLKSFKYAFKGLFLLVTTEHSIIVQLFFAAAVTALGFYFDISKQDWISQSLTIAIVLCAEGLNSAIEQICDFVHPDHHSKIGKIKDVAAGAVTFTAIISLVVFLLIYYPHFTSLISF